MENSNEIPPYDPKLPFYQFLRNQELNSKLESFIVHSIAFINSHSDSEG